MTPEEKSEVAEGLKVAGVGLRYMLEKRSSGAPTPILMGDFVRGKGPGKAVLPRSLFEGEEVTFTVKAYSHYGHRLFTVSITAIRALKGRNTGLFNLFGTIVPTDESDYFSAKKVKVYRYDPVAREGRLEIFA